MRIANPAADVDGYISTNERRSAGWYAYLLEYGHGPVKVHSGEEVVVTLRSGHFSPGFSDCIPGGVELPAAEVSIIEGIELRARTCKGRIFSSCPKR